jgi:hypothetical protein
MSQCLSQTRRKSPMKTLSIALLFLLVLPGYVFSDYSTLRDEINCGMSIVRIGAPQHEVLRWCGEPDGAETLPGLAGTRDKWVYDRGWNGWYELNFVGDRLDEVREHYQ